MFITLLAILTAHGGTILLNYTLECGNFLSKSSGDLKWSLQDSRIDIFTKNAEVFTHENFNSEKFGKLNFDKFMVIHQCFLLEANSQY